MGFLLYLLYIISYFLHLPARIPALGVMRFDFVLAIVLFIVLLSSKLRDENGQKYKPQKFLELLVIYIIITFPMVTWPGSVLDVGAEPWIKAALFFFFTVKAIKSEVQFKIAIWVFVGCQVFRVLEPTYLHLTDGYWGSIAFSHVGGNSVLNRLSGAPLDVVNPTQLSWVAVNVVSFLFYLGWQGGNFGKVLVISISPLFFYGFALTGARGGMVCMAIVILGIVWFSKNRVRNAVIASVLVVIVMAVFFGKMSSDLQTRYLSLVESDVAGADTVQGRFNALNRYIKTLSYRPVIGNGLGTSREVNWNYSGNSSQITHCMYLEIAQELGFVGLFIFLLYMFSIYKLLHAARALVREKKLTGTWIDRTIKALLVWFFMDVVYSISVFGLRSWEWYLFGGFATLALYFAEQADCQEVTEAQITGDEITHRRFRGNV